MASAGRAEVLMRLRLVGIVVADLRAAGRAEEFEGRWIGNMPVGDARLLAEGAVAGSARAPRAGIAAVHVPIAAIRLDRTVL